MRGTALATILLLATVVTEAATPIVAARGDHALALKSNGTLAGWGRDGDGQLATGRILFSATPRSIDGLPSIQGVSAYSEHVLALDAQGDVWAWGSNKFGQLGRRAQRNAALPDRVLGASGVAAVAATNTFSAALKRDGTVWVWGGSPNPEVNFQATLDPVRINGLEEIVQISGGLQHVLARKRDGTVWAFGTNAVGELGNGTLASSMTATQVRGLANVTDIAAGTNGSVALTADGRLWTWGRLTANYLATGNPIPRQQPTTATRPVKVAAGLNGYFVADDGSVWGFGDDQPSPEQLSGLLGIISADISSGTDFFVGVTRDATVVTLSSNSFGEAGIGNTTPLPGIATYASLSQVVQAVFGSGFVLAVTSNGKLWVWGRDVEGALAVGSTILYPAPVAIDGLPSIAKVAAAMQASLALDVNGNVWVWGTNQNIGLGTGATTPASRPQQVPISGVVDIAAGWTHFLYLKGDGSVWAAGLAPGIASSVPIQLQGLPPIVKIAAGWSSSYFVDAAGALFAMSENSSGQAGDGTFVNRETPVRVASISEPVVQVAADFRLAAAITSSGAVYQWGDLRGLSGLGDGPPIPTPQLVAGLTAVEIALFNSALLARTAEGRVMSVGTGPEIGRDGPPYPPGLVEELDSVISIAANIHGSYAVRADGTVWGWGSSSGTNSLVGDGTFTTRPRPVLVLREGGAGTLPTNDWYLDAKPGIPKAIPTNKVPAVLALASAGDLSAIANVDANLKFRSQDAGKGIRVFAYAPSALTKSAKDATNCVLSQLTSSGLQQVSAGALQTVGTVVASQQATLAILSNVPTSQIAGATFCVGAGESGSQAVDPANSHCVVTVPAADTCPAPRVAVVAATAGALSGLWWNVNESGWGIHFTQRRNIVFAAWYTYDAVGNPKWYVASNCTLPAGSTGTSGACSGSLFEVSGPTFFGAAFNPSLVNVAAAGTLQVNFQNANNAVMTYSLGGFTRTVPITRPQIGSGSTAPAVDYTDIWWNPGESGWGMAIAHQFTNMFLAWYVYDPAGKPVWYVASNCTVGANGCTGTLYRTTGPPFGPTFDPARVQVSTAGTVSISFTDANNATLTYSVGGTTASKAITRQVF